jgi:YD repeat-containing protein
MSGDDELTKAKEVDKPTETSDNPDRLRGDSVTTMAERVELGKGDESYTKQKKFTVGDGGFSIAGLESTEKLVKDGGKQEQGKPVDLQPASILHPNGEETKLEYDKSGNPTKVAFNYDVRLEKQSDGSWKESGYANIPRKYGDVKDVDVNGEGQVTVTRTDKTSVVLNKDGSELNTDASKHITEIIGPKGQKTEIPKYEDGKPALIILPSGETLDKQADGTWNKFKPDGTAGEPFVGDINVSKDGTLTFKGKDKSEEVKHPDGSSVTTDKDGHVTRVEKTNGSVREMKYENGKLAEISMGKDGSIKKEGDEWVQRDASGKETRSKGDIHYDKDGSRVDVTSEVTRISARDGSSKLIYKDNSQLSMDSDKRVTEFVDNEGHKTSIKYGHAGRYNLIEPIERTTQSGSVWKREEDDSWSQYRDGKSTGKVFHGRVDVSENGDITRSTTDGKVVDSRHPDGSFTYGENPRETRDKYGQMVEQYYPSEQGNRDKIVSYDHGKMSRVEVGPNYTWQHLPNGQWQKEVGGEEPGPPQDVNLTFTDSGDLMVTSKGGKPIEVAHLDGKISKYKPDGSVVKE